MNLQFYLKKLHASEEFKKFKKENPTAFLCSAFFSIDKTGNDNKQHFDFFNKGEIISFQLEENCKRVLLENPGKEIPLKIPEDTDFDFREVEKIIEDKMKTENINNKIQKIFVSLQNVKWKSFIIGTVFISGLGIIKVNMDLGKKEITDFEKKSFFDMLNIIKK